MAIVHGSVDEVGLALQHTNTIVQLLDDAQSLTRSRIVGGYKGTVMGGNLGDVTVPAIAELRVIVARLSVCGLV